MKGIRRFAVCMLALIVMLGSAPAINFAGNSTNSVIITAYAASSKIKLNKTKLYVIEGKTATLKVKGTKKKVKWSSSKKSVAAVNSKGKITAKKKGTATITAKVAGKKLKCKVTVEAPSISVKKAELEKGDTMQLKIKGTKQKVVWSSNDESIATVSDNGIVTAIKVGNVKITAKVGGKKYSCKINIFGYGNISGNVTFYYNSYQGHKADAGSEVYLIPTDGTAKKLPSVLSIDTYGADYKTFKTTVGATGSFDLYDIPTGEYVLYVVSEETNSEYAFDDSDAYQEEIEDFFESYLSKDNAETLAIFTGLQKYDIQFVEIKDGRTTNYSHDFGITYFA